MRDPTRDNRCLHTPVHCQQLLQQSETRTRLTQPSLRTRGQGRDWSADAASTVRCATCWPAGRRHLAKSRAANHRWDLRTHPPRRNTRQVRRWRRGTRAPLANREWRAKSPARGQSEGRAAAAGGHQTVWPMRRKSGGSWGSKDGKVARVDAVAVSGWNVASHAPTSRGS